MAFAYWLTTVKGVTLAFAVLYDSGKSYYQTLMYFETCCIISRNTTARLLSETKFL